MGPGGNFKDGLHSAQVQRSTPPGLTQIVNLYLLPRGRCWFTNADYPGHLALQIHSASSSLLQPHHLSQSFHRSAQWAASPDNSSRITRSPHPSRHGALGCLINDQEKGKAVAARRPGPAVPEAHRTLSQSGRTEAGFAGLIVSQPCEGVPSSPGRAGPTWSAALGGF